VDIECVIPHLYSQASFEISCRGAFKAYIVVLLARGRHPTEFLLTFALGLLSKAFTFRLLMLPFCLLTLRSQLCRRRRRCCQCRPNQGGYKNQKENKNEPRSRAKERAKDTI
jgi:hypothetical protein